MMSQLDVVDYLLEQDEILKNTKIISEYMETSLNTTRNYEDYILNAIKFGYTNE